MPDTMLMSFTDLPMPSARLDVQDAADLTTLEAIADAHAFEVWGEEIARGDAFPVADANGDVRAYVFPYSIGTRTFPAIETLAGGPPDGTSQFGAIYVAARRMMHPVLRVVHSLHPLFVHGEEAQRIGRLQLAAGDARLTRIYWLGLHQEYFEITSADRRLLLDIHTLREKDREIALKPSAPPQEEREQDVAAGDLTSPVPTAFEADGQALATTQKLVALEACVPVVNWTWWCVPTAWTMATCYYDNYVKNVGGITGYGRLVGYWFDHPKSTHNVPDFIDQLIDPATGTWRKGFSGYTDFIKKTYGYDFSVRAVNASAANDWAWADIVKEIDAGRPFVWGVPNHATCGLGYRLATNGKFVVVHTTWGDTQKEQREEWKYTEGTKLEAITPGGGTQGQNLVMWAPDGGETLLTGVATGVSWYVWGDQIKTAEISVSADGGNTWTSIAKAAPCNKGWNRYDWTPNAITKRARVRIRGNNAGGAFIAGDGSQSNVTVLQGPRPVTLKTFLVNATTDGKGFFSAPHGLERYTPDGYAIRAISVAAQHKNGNWHTLEFSNNVDNRFWWNKNVVAGVINAPNFFERSVQVVISAEYIVG
ncbi:MAG: hypothetical protein H6905_10435 [Hyphomicrobiales bacterium]|nr:hypothetical protein [Hyphomicrobiales bacterium]